MLRRTLPISLAFVLLAGGGTAAAIQEAKSAPRETADEEPSAETVVEYYESGRYDRDVERLGREARRALRRQIADEDKAGREPAIVLDIDDTSLSSYPCQKRLGDFGGTELAACVVEAGAETQTGLGKGFPVIDPVLRVYKLALRREVKVFFITGRPDTAKETSRQNLAVRGFEGPLDITTFPSPAPETMNSLIPYKSGERARVERDGFEIVLNIGDQESDLRGGHANRKFLLPNPMYFTK